MSDGYIEFANRPLGRFLCSQFGLPIPPILQRAGDNPEDLVSGIHIHSDISSSLHDAINNALAPVTEHKIERSESNSVVFDASQISHSSELNRLYQTFNPILKTLTRNAKVVIIGLEPRTLSDVKQATAQRALIGFVKALAKEFGRKGFTVNLLYVTSSVSNELAAPLRFLCSKRNAYVTGQVLSVDNSSMSGSCADLSWQAPLSGKLALVTGAAQGIGAAMAKTLARDGATVIGLDMPQAQQQLAQTMDAINGESLLLNMCDEDAASQIQQHLNGRTLDIVVHNAGITRDKTLGRMKAQQWDMLMDVNLSAIERVTDHLLSHELIAQGGRIIGVSSISGIAGNAGQTNYATSKAGIIGFVDSMTPLLAEKNITINAVAPGFIETKMTAAIPFMPRQIGRRACSLSQGGLPIDVAEAVALFAAPQAQGLTGNVLRVCGQNIVGA